MNARVTRRGFVAGGAAVAGGLVALSSVAGTTNAPVQARAEEATVDESLIAPAQMNAQDYAAAGEGWRSNTTDFATLFSPWQFGGLEIKNRIVKSAAGSDTGKNNEECVAYYRAFAHGGVDMVWVEDFVDKYEHFPMTRGVPMDTAPLKELADAIHEEGGHIGYQISCMGIPFSGTQQTASGSFASAVAGDMTIDEIHTLQQDSANFAKQLQDLGWDAVEINAAGNNIGQSFFSRMRNKRDDEYGPQSFENRARFVCEMIQGIKEACGQDFPVQVLINGIEENDTNLGDSTLMTTVEENLEIAKCLEAAGANSLHVRLGPLGMHVCQFASDLYFTGYHTNADSTFDREASMLSPNVPQRSYMLEDPMDIGRHVVLWEYATAFMGWLMEVTPFNQPDVQAAKTNTKAILAGHLPDRTHRLAEPWVCAEYSDEFASQTGIVDPTQMRSVDSVIDAFMSLVEPGCWISVNAFLPFTGERRGPMEVIRHTLARHLRVPCSLEIGPRYLHSTGQLQKGGENTGLFLILSGNEVNDLQVPNTQYSLGQLEVAQSKGDLETLSAKGRRALHLHMIDTDADTLWRLAHAFEEAGTRIAIKRALGK